MWPSTARDDRSRRPGWSFTLDGRPHRAVLGEPSVVDDLPIALVLDGTRVGSDWRKTTTWREWDVARWDRPFTIDGHPAILHATVRRPSSWWSRFRRALLPSLRGTARAGSYVGARAAIDAVHRWSFRLEVDGRRIDPEDPDQTPDVMDVGHGGGQRPYATEVPDDA